MAITKPDALWAACSVSPTGDVVANGGVRRQAGHQGPGQYLITLDAPIDEQQCVILATLRDGDASVIRWSKPDDRTLLVRTFNFVGDPVDAPFDVLVVKP